MSTVLDDEAMLEMAPGLDWGSLDLTQEQGFVLTRVVGRITVRELMALSGLPPIAAKSAIVALVRAGALLIEGESGSISKAQRHAAKPERNESDKAYEGFVFSPASLGEAADLNEAQKKRILYVYAHLKDWNHYALLGLKRTAKSGEIKRGYFKASKEFHPDAYFRKQLGSFKPKIDEIFRAMKAAYDVLSNDDRRKEYDSTLGADFTPEELAELEKRAAERREKLAAEKAERDKAEAEKRRLERLAERKKAKRISRNPMLDNLKKAREYAEMAKAEMVKKNHKTAARHARLALEFSRNHPSIEEEVGGILVEADQTRAEVMLRSAANSIMSDEEQLRKIADEASELAHGKAKILLDAADLYAQLKDLRRAIKLAQTAAAESPELERAWRSVADFAERGGQLHTALRAAEKLMEIAPRDGSNKDRVKRLKREVR